jgi:carbon dioxide concentrating mechanism protein CcmN
MHLQTLQSVGIGWNSTPSPVCASGDVTIHPSAVIAPGVILQAAPNSRITIAEGVCVGMGAVLNACEGTIEIGNGATLGAGVLMVGSGKIGSRACVGAATTIFNQSIAPWQVIPAGSLIGDSSRSVEDSPASETVEKPNANSNSEATPVSPEDSHSTPAAAEPPVSSENTVAPAAEEPVPETEEVAESAEGQTADPKADEETPIYGQVYVNRILWTIFPQGRSPNSSP